MGLHSLAVTNDTVALCRHHYNLLHSKFAIIAILLTIVCKIIYKSIMKIRFFSYV